MAWCRYNKPLSPEYQKALERIAKEQYQIDSHQQSRRVNDVRLLVALCWERAGAGEMTLDSMLHQQLGTAGLALGALFESWCGCGVQLQTETTTVLVRSSKLRSRCLRSSLSLLVDRVCYYQLLRLEKGLMMSLQGAGWMIFWSAGTSAEHNSTAAVPLLCTYLFSGGLH